MNCTALVPAAGIGQRFGSGQPKQYTRIHGHTILEHTLHRLLAEPRIERIAIVLAPEDQQFAEHIRPPEAHHNRILPLYCGGAERAQSVLNGIQALFAQQLIHEHTPLLVHDAARCCLPIDALSRLIDHAAAHPTTGAILALPVADTLKYSQNGQHIDHTHSRQGLWQAQTPQLFPAGLLQHALQQADPKQTTDEASAIEQLGHTVHLIQGDSRNIKLTLPSDIHLVRQLLTDPDIQTKHT